MEFRQEVSLGTALSSMKAVCPATCSCAKETNPSAQREREPQKVPLGATQRPECHLTTRNYLKRVYPTAADKIGAMSPMAVETLFRSLHFYYDHGCNVAKAAGCAEPGVALKYLYSGLLPCNEEPRPRGSHQSTRLCAAAHFRFAPAWAETARAAGWAEVEHRAVGLGTKRFSGQLVPLAADGVIHAPSSAFLDPGVAGMWYTFRRGSGVFYRMGKTKIAPGKTAMMASLLHELAGTDQRRLWPAFADRSSLFSEPGPPRSTGAKGDAERLRAVANGSAHCGAAGVAHCRCKCVLHDVWDDALVWAARVLQYQTLFFTATLLCNQVPNSTFTTAYPELVDVRPLESTWAEEQANGTHSMLVKPELSSQDSGLLSAHDGLDVFLWRKRPSVADQWTARMRASGVLSLRDPLAPADDGRSSPCNFSVAKESLQCDGHISSSWPSGEWHACTLPMCGHKGMWVQRRPSATLQSSARR